eukprot:gene15879-biopygen14292
MAPDDTSRGTVAPTFATQRSRLSPPEAQGRRGGYKGGAYSEPGCTRRPPPRRPLRRPPQRRPPPRRPLRRSPQCRPPPRRPIWGGAVFER